MKKTVCVTLTNRTNYSKFKAVLMDLRKNSLLDCRITLSSTILLEHFSPDRYAQ